MIDYWGQTEQRWGSTQVLEVPEQEGEDDANAEAHKPGDEQNGHVLRKHVMTINL